MSTRGGASGFQPCGCVSCLLLLFAFWIVSWVVSIVVWTTSALWSLVVGFGPTILGVVAVWCVARLGVVPPDKKQVAACCAFVAGVLLNALMLFAQPQYQPWVLDSVLGKPTIVVPAQAPTPSTPSTPLANSSSPANGAKPATSPQHRSQPTALSTSVIPAAQIVRSSSAVVPLRRQKLTSLLSVNNRFVDVPQSSRAEFAVVRWTVAIRNNSARSSLPIEYSISYYGQDGSPLDIEAGLRESANPQIRDMAHIRSIRRFVLNARPKTIRVVVLSELVPRTVATQIRRSIISLKPTS